MIFSCCALILTFSILAQTKHIEVFNKTKTEIQNVTDLDVIDDRIAILSDEYLILYSIGGKILERQKCENTYGIGFNKIRNELWFIDNKSTVTNLNKSISLELKSKNKNVLKKYIAITDNGYVAYIDEGWSSRLAFFNLTGEEVTSIFAPGLGNISGVTFFNKDLWVIFDLGANKKGIIRKYYLKETEMSEDEVIELPIQNTKGLGIDNNGYFYTYSEVNTEIVKFKIR